MNSSVSMTPSSGGPTLSTGSRRVLLWLALALALFPLAISKPGLPTSLKSDEPAYYLAALSLARDGDLQFEAGEAERLFDEFPYMTVKNLILMTEDGWRTVYYGKPYIYSLFAAPFAGLFGANGMVSFNMLLLMAMVWMGASYLRRFNPDALAVAYSAGFFVLSSTFTYVFWMHPELFNMACVTASLYLAFKPVERAPAALAGRWRRLFGEAARPLWSAACLAPAVYNKPMLALLALAPLWVFTRRQSWRGFVRFCAGALVAGGLVAGLSLALTGKASAYLGVNRRGWNVAHSEFMPPVVPMQAPAQSTNAGSWWWILDAPTAEAGETLENARYFLFGRHTGLFVYGPFALLSLMLFLVHRRRSRKRWLLLASLAGVALVFLLWIPFNWHGGGGFVGNRYYINVYPGFLFLVARIAPAWLTGLGYAAGGLLAGSLLFTPFGAPVHRPTLQAHVRHQPFGLFPFEFSIRDQIPGYVGASQLGKWFLGRADQFEPNGEEMWLHGNSEVSLWIFSHEPLIEATFWVRSVAPGNTVRLSLPGDETVLDFGDEPASQTASLRPTGPSQVRFEEGKQVYVYDFAVDSARGWSTRRFHLGAAIAYLGEPGGIERDIWDVEWLECDFPAAVALSEEPFSGAVRLRNTSAEAWPTGPGGRVKLAYHWFDESGATVSFEGARSAFESAVAAGEEVGLSQRVLMPETPGRYRLQLDLVYEFVGWFSERGAPTCEAEVEVLPAPGPASSSQSSR
jgi:hypothetical protein